MTKDETQFPKTQTQARSPRCPACAALPRLVYTMQDGGSGRTIRFYQCQCGERIWDD